MTHRANLASEPYFEQVLNPDPYFPQRDRVVRCDCFLLDADDKPFEPPALIQLISGPRIKHPVPVRWKAGDILILTPTMSLGWNDTQETASEAMGWCGITATFFAPALRTKYYLGFVALPSRVTPVCTMYVSN